MDKKPATRCCIVPAKPSAQGGAYLKRAPKGCALLGLWAGDIELQIRLDPNDIAALTAALPSPPLAGLHITGTVINRKE